MPAAVVVTKATPADEILQALAMPQAINGLTLPALISRLPQWSVPFIQETIVRLGRAGEIETDTTRTPAIVRLTGRTH